MKSKSLRQIVIRPEEKGDVRAIEGVLKRSFNGDYESELVERIRNSSDYIPELALVAEVEGKIVGFNLLSTVSLVRKDSSRKILSLGPLAVEPECQSQGIGSMLIRYALAEVDKTDFDIVVLLGHADYYPRFGFVSASLHDVYPPLPWDDGSFMVRVREGRGTPKGGLVIYPESWELARNFSADNLVLREAKIEDMGQVARVFKISFRDAMPNLPVLHSDTEDRKFFSTSVFESDTVIIAVEDGESFSTVWGFIAFNEDFVNHLYVLPVGRRSGIGRRLMALAKAQREELSLWAFQQNKPALSFYANEGFNPVRYTDGEGNEEREPDVLLRWSRDS